MPKLASVLWLAVFAVVAGLNLASATSPTGPIRLMDPNANSLKEAAFRPALTELRENQHAEKPGQVLDSALANVVTDGRPRPEIAYKSPAFKTNLRLSDARTIDLTASTFQTPNTPENVLDNDPSTRWSALGYGQWIAFDLGSAQNIIDVNIGFHRGDVRKADIDIQISTNGVEWQTVFSGSQPQYSLDEQSFDISGSVARYVRLLGYGNEENNWNSITSVRIQTHDIQEWLN